MRGESPLRRVMLYVAALLVAAFWFGPLLLVGVASLVPDGNLLSFPPRWFDDGIFFGNYEYILTGTLPETYLQPGALRGAISQEVRFVPRSMLNSAIVATGVALTNIVLGSLAAYAFARLRFPGRDALFWVYLATLMVPQAVTIIPLYAVFADLGLRNTFWALVLPQLFGSPYAIFLLREYFRGIPGELLDAARLDGCGTLRILRHVVVPISRPILTTLAIITVVTHWNTFLWPLVITAGPQWQVITVATAALQDQYNGNWTIVMAATTLAVAPLLILFLIFQRNIIRSITITGFR